MDHNEQRSEIQNNENAVHKEQMSSGTVATDAGGPNSVSPNDNILFQRNSQNKDGNTEQYATSPPRLKIKKSTSTTAVRDSKQKGSGEWNDDVKILKNIVFIDSTSKNSGVVVNPDTR